MSTQLIATGIRTLHDARYFAAMGASWIGFDLSVMSIDEFNAISEWVVGPLTFVELQSAEAHELHELTQKTGIKGVSVPLSVEVPEGFEGIVIRRSDMADIGEPLPSSAIVVITLSSGEVQADTIELLTAFCTTHSCWVEVAVSDLSFLSTLRDISPQGIVIRCQEVGERRPSSIRDTSSRTPVSRTTPPPLPLGEGERGDSSLFVTSNSEKRFTPGATAGLSSSAR
jgi:hypothetical protein